MANYLKNLRNAVLNKSHVNYGNSFYSDSVITKSKNFFGSIFGIFGGFKLDKYVDFFYTNHYLFQTIDKIASIVAALPRKLEDDKGKEITEEEILRLWNRPNFDQSRKTFTKILATNFLATGNAFVRYVTAIGFTGVQEQTVLRSKDIKINTNFSGVKTGYDYRNFGTTVTIPLDQIGQIHEPNIISNDSNQYYGVSRVEPIKPAVITSNEVQIAQANTFKNGGAANIITNKSDYPMLPDERKRVQEGLDSQLGGAEKANKNVVSNHDLAVLNIGMSPTQLKLIESGVAQQRIITAGYSLSSVLFNDPENNTYNSQLEAQRSAYRDSYIPTAEFLDDEQSHELSIRFDTPIKIVIDRDKIEILQETKAEQSLRILDALAVGVLTIEEARERLIEIDRN